MSDINVVYDEVAAVASKLNQVASDTVPKLAQIDQRVTQLLSQGGGLWLLQSSPVLNDKYKAFNDSVTKAVSSIPQWAQQFNNIVSQLQDLDRQIVDSANKSS